VLHENDDGGERQSDCCQRDADRGGPGRDLSPSLIAGANVGVVASSHPLPEAGRQGTSCQSGNEHVEIHLSRIGGRSSGLHAGGQHDLRADFSRYWFSATGQGGPEVSPATLPGITAIDAAVGIGFYGPVADSD
jgi:hypothetical protein